MQHARNRKFLPRREILEMKISISKETFKVISPLREQFEKCTISLNVEELPFLSIILNNQTWRLKNELKELYL